MDKITITKHLRLEFLGHIFKSREEYGLVVFGFYSILFFGIGFLIGISLNTVFKSFKTTKKISANPFLIGLWGMFLGAYISSDYLYLTRKAHIVIDRIILFGLVFLGFYILSNIIGELISLYVKSRTQEVPSSILKASIVIFISTVGLFIAFQSIGLSISPLITTLGVGTVVIGLALQDTLSNFLSGFYILVSKNIRVGDYIKFDVYEGYVEDIYWRTTHIRTLSGNVIVVPNSKLTSSVITNYHLPYENMAVVFSFSVGYKEDLDRVEKLLIEIAKDIVSKVDGADKTYEPIVRYGSFGASGINLSLVVKVKEFVNQYLIIHELIKAIKKRFDQENIEIPYQTINVMIKNES
ncbi:MAG: mechanosensitive ion channel family protein [Hydrogenobaculum sp.]